MRTAEFFATLGIELAVIVRTWSDASLIVFPDHLLSLPLLLLEVLEVIRSCRKTYPA